jgi:3-oxoacyl-[acyl-carrier-protein] synthase-3
MYFPGTCSFLQVKLGLPTTPGLDIRAQCSGFIYGLEVGQALVASGQYPRLLLVGVEVQSVALEKSDRGRDMAVLFGDGAGAVILEASDDPKTGVLRVITHLEGANADKLKVQSPSTQHQAWLQPSDISEGLIHPKMDGKYVFKNAVTRMPEVIGEVLAKEQLKVQDVDFWLFHQANLRINEHIVQAMGISQDKVYNNIQKYGNMSAASIPVAFDECVRSGRIKRGDLVMMTAFGAGFTWGSALVRY